METFVFRNTKKRGNIEDLVKKAVSEGWVCTLIACRRYSERGKVEDIYVMTSGFEDCQPRQRVSYVTDTGRGHGGKGVCEIQEVGFVGRSGLGTALSKETGWRKKRPIYVMV